MDQNGRYKVALTACSDPLSKGRVWEVGNLAGLLEEAGLEVVNVSDPVSSGSVMRHPRQKAQLLMDCFRDPQMDYIFDVSGGDLANTVLPYLDFEVIGKSRAVMCGYSDLTTLLNAIVTKTGKRVINYQIRNLMYDHADEQKTYFFDRLLPGRLSIADLELSFLRGKQMRGSIIGGNIRCFLKLAGTPYWPDPSGRILLLEAMGGGVEQMMTALEQYRQMGVFGKINGVLLGTFSRMEEQRFRPSMEELVLSLVPETVPVAKTHFIGHSTDARAVVLGHGHDVLTV